MLGLLRLLLRGLGRTELGGAELGRAAFRRSAPGRPARGRPVPGRRVPGRPVLRRAGPSAPAPRPLALLGRDQLGCHLLLGCRGPTTGPAPPGRLGDRTVPGACRDHSVGSGFGLGRTGAAQERIGRRPARPAPPATGDARRPHAFGRGRRSRGGLHRRLRGRDGARGGADRDVEDVRAAAHPRHLVGLEHTAVRLDDAAHDRLVHRVSPGERPAHLDPYDVTALGGGHDDGRVDVSAAGDGPGLTGRVDAADVRDEVGEGVREPDRVDLGLDGRGVHGELGAPGPDQFDRPVDPARHDPVDHRGGLVQPLHTRVEALVAQHAVDERGHPGVPGGEVVQDLVGLGPQLPRRVGGEHGQLTAQLLQGPAQRTAEDGGELGVLGAHGGEQLGLPLQLGGVPLGPVGQLGGVGLLERLQLGRVRFLQRGDLVGVAGGQLGDDALVLGGELLVRPAVGEGHHGADELVAVAHGRGRQVHRHLGAALGPEHLAPYAVLAPRLEGVGERRLLVRERLALRPRVQDQRVQLLAAEVAGAEAEDLGGGGVDEDDAPVRVGAHDALGGGAQDHLGLALRTGQLGLGVDGAGEVPYDEHEQLVTGVAGVDVVVRGLAAVQAGAGDLDRVLVPVGTARDHARRLGPALLVRSLGPAHRSRDQLGVELRQQIQQSTTDERGARGLEHLKGDGVGVDDRAVAIDEQKPVRKGIEYGCEASSASGWPAAHDDASSLVTAPCRQRAPSCPSGRRLSLKESKARGGPGGGG
ncbi:hypothetical protein GA0115243_1012109 [Streptomyces sp. ScaeMP-e83]|nr:hypothetical protein GA0115243_1012109 [Streptomyces sp. ScaeMP-e83]